MAIVATDSSAYDTIAADRTKDLVDPIRNRAELRAVVATVANLAGDLDGSVYRLFAMPSRGIIRAESRVDLTGWGYAAATIGLAKNGVTLTANGLVTTVTIGSLAGAFTPIIAAFGAKWGMPVWQAAGLASDPGGIVDVIIATAANATGAGDAHVDAIWHID